MCFLLPSAMSTMTWSSPPPSPDGTPLQGVVFPGFVFFFSAGSGSACRVYVGGTTPVPPLHGYLPPGPFFVPFSDPPSFFGVGLLAAVFRAPRRSGGFFGIVRTPRSGRRVFFSWNFNFLPPLPTLALLYLFWWKRFYLAISFLFFLSITSPPSSRDSSYFFFFLTFRCGVCDRLFLTFRKAKGAPLSLGVGGISPPFWR